MGKLQDGTPNIFTNEQYNSWFKQFRDQFLPFLFNTEYDNCLFLESS